MKAKTQHSHTQLISGREGLKYKLSGFKLLIFLLHSTTAEIGNGSHIEYILCQCKDVQSQKGIFQVVTSKQCGKWQKDQGERALRKDD